MTNYDDSDYSLKKRNRKQPRKVRADRREGDDEKPRQRDRTRSSESRDKSARMRSRKRRSVDPTYRTGQKRRSGARKVTKPEAFQKKPKREGIVSHEPPAMKEVTVREPFDTSHEAGRCPYGTGYCDGELAWEFSNDKGDVENRCAGYICTLHWDL